MISPITGEVLLSEMKILFCVPHTWCVPRRDREACHLSQSQSRRRTEGCTPNEHSFFQPRIKDVERKEKRIVLSMRLLARDKGFQELKTSAPMKMMSFECLPGQQGLRRGQALLGGFDQGWLSQRDIKP